VGARCLIQITPQIGILVAIEPIDARIGIDSLAQLCREKRADDPFSGRLFIFRSRRGTAIKLLAYDGQGFGLDAKRLSKGRFRWWPTGDESNACAAGAPGAVAAGGRQSGSRSRAGMAARQRLNKKHKGPGPVRPESSWELVKGGPADRRRPTNFPCRRTPFRSQR
jgi:transposase